MPIALLFYLVTAIAAALAIGVGVLFPALGQTHAAMRAMQAIARQPEEAPIITRNLYIGLAMIESQALYVLIVALILLFADPLASRLTEAAARGPLGRRRADRLRRDGRRRRHGGHRAERRWARGASPVRPSRRSPSSPPRASRSPPRCSSAWPCSNRSRCTR